MRPSTAPSASITSQRRVMSDGRGVNVRNWTTSFAATEGNPGREQAIYALAMNRTDAGVVVLKRLLGDPTARIREHTTAVIRDAYHQRGNARGRPLRPEDFPDLARRL
jgi:hypothetical protein